MDRTEDHERVIDDGIAPLYKERIENLLRRVGEVCAEAGLQVERGDDGKIAVWDMCADEFKWAIGVWRADADREEIEQIIDISFELAEALTYGDDEEHDGYGINFGLDIVEWGGRILGGLCPYNYTEACWIDARDSEAVEERFQIMETADLSEIPHLIAEREE